MSYPKSMAALVPGLARKALGGGRSAIGSLFADWPSVVGEHWAGRAVPDKLSFPAGRRDGGTLALRVDPADALELQHDQDRLIERINGHFGYAAIARLKLVQAPLDRRPATPRRRSLTAGEEAMVAKPLEAVDDPQWKSRLAAFGRALYARTPR
jgi:hypothetical protein